MTPFSVLILICALSVNPSRCTPESAVDVVYGPHAENEFLCGLLGQTTLATSAIAPREGKDYIKIVCQRDKEGNVVSR